ncbi:MAG: endonuclease YncB(thermonuclease family) [Arenicella sp.]|jgi:endonuclease YncB( thermonuclease family)
MNQVSALFSLIGVQLLMANAVLGASIEGPVTHYVDGDSIKIWKQSIRLIDIDTPEVAQDCINSRGKAYACGVEASNALKRIVGKQQVKCVGDQVDRYKRLLATCYVGDININRELVLRGWAVNYRTSKKYSDEQSMAMEANKGLWAGEFLEPYKFRQRGQEFDPKAEQANRYQPAAKNQSATGIACNIKGNISGNRRIYHTRWGSRSYSKTRIDVSKGERWFCSEEEAEKAGWRAAKR